MRIRNKNIPIRVTEKELEIRFFMGLFGRKTHFCNRFSAISKEFSPKTGIRFSLILDIK